MKICISKECKEKCEGHFENRNKFIEKQEESQKELKLENEELRKIIKDIEKVTEEQQHNSVINLKNKIKSILMTAKSI